MGTIDKAFSLLVFFKESRASISLAEMTRLAGYDKATTRRLLQSLVHNGMLERDPVSGGYRIGPLPQKLAALREKTVPLDTLVRNTLTRLTAETQETTHFSVVTEAAMILTAVNEPDRATRVVFDAGEEIPFHTTASGLSYLAFSPEPVVDRILSETLKSVTRYSIVDPAVLRAMLPKIRKASIAEVDQLNEIDVHGIAAPVFDQAGAVYGALAVALPVHRVTARVRKDIAALVRREARNLSIEIGGSPPETEPDGNRKPEPAA